MFCTHTYTHTNHTQFQLQFSRLWDGFSKSSLCGSKNSPKDMGRQRAEGKALVSLGKCEVHFLHSTRDKWPKGQQKNPSTGQRGGCYYYQNRANCRVILLNIKKVNQCSGPFLLLNLFYNI